LLTEGAARKVGALGEVEDGAKGRFVDGAAVDGPEAAEDAEEGRLAAAVGADDEEMVAVLEGEGEGFDEDVTVGRDDGSRGFKLALGISHVVGADLHIDKGYVLALVDCAAALENRFIVFNATSGNKILLKVARLDIIHDIQQRSDSRGVASQLHNLTVRKHDTAKGIGSTKQHAAVCDE
jgi:hypothetical protein